MNRYVYIQTHGTYARHIAGKQKNKQLKMLVSSRHPSLMQKLHFSVAGKSNFHKERSSQAPYWHVSEKADPLYSPTHGNNNKDENPSLSSAVKPSELKSTIQWIAFSLDSFALCLAVVKTYLQDCADRITALEVKCGALEKCNKLLSDDLKSGSRRHHLCAFGNPENWKGPWGRIDW